MNINNVIDSKKKLQSELKLFNKNIGSFLKLYSLEASEEFFLNDEIKSKEAIIINKLNDYDNTISNIIENKLKREEGENTIQSIKEFIDFEVKEIKKIYSDLKNLGLKKCNEIIESSKNRICLILRFLQRPEEKINNAEKNIYEKHEKYLNILIMEENQYKNYLQEYLSNDIDLFEEWKNEKEKEKKFKKFLKQDILLQNFHDLLTLVKIDIDYSYDEKFILWAIKNDFSKYLK